MKYVINIPRPIAQEWPDVQNRSNNRRWFNASNVHEKIGRSPAWISIGEPEGTFRRVSNPVLDKEPNLKLEFWDLTDTLDYLGEVLEPPSGGDARMIVDFIIANKDRNILVNCAAGVSRSGAVCQFCEDVMGYEWLVEGKNLATPNTTLYIKMVNYYNSLNLPQKEI